MAGGNSFCGLKTGTMRRVGVCAVLAVCAACAEPFQTRGTPTLSDEAISIYCEKEGHESASPAFQQCVKQIRASELLRRKVAETMAR